jgi:CheY-like chemotaxis protein
MLEGLGHQVATAASGMEGLRMLDHAPLPDLVMLDQNMPGLTGMETLLRLRIRHAHLPVLMTSGYLQDANLKALARDPQVFILPKPFTRAELERKLAEVDRSADFIGVPLTAGT